MMKRFAALVLPLALLLGCASSTSVTKSDLQDYGFLVGRFPVLEHAIHFQDVANVTDQSLPIFKSANPMRIARIGPGDTALCFKVKEGTYYIQAIYGAKSGLLGNSVYHIGVPLGLRRPIVVKKGSILYIGSFSYDLGGMFSESTVQFSTSMNGIGKELAADYPDLRAATLQSLFE
jgi:hypothetical protein